MNTDQNSSFELEQKKNNRRNLLISRGMFVIAILALAVSILGQRIAVILKRRAELVSNSAKKIRAFRYSDTIKSLQYVNIENNGERGSPIKSLRIVLTSKVRQAFKIQMDADSIVSKNVPFTHIDIAPNDQFKEAVSFSTEIDTSSLKTMPKGTYEYRLEAIVDNTDQPIILETHLCDILEKEVGYLTRQKKVRYKRHTLRLFPKFDIILFQ